MNSKAIPTLSILLVVQIALAFGLHYAETMKSSGSTKKLISANLSSCDQIILADKNNKSRVTIKKNGDAWVLPDLYNFPASSEAVTRLLDKLKGLSSGWPVATTEDAAPRFKVSSTDYEERIELSSAGKALAVAYIGSSAGNNKVHLRLENSNEINAVEVPSREISTAIDDWFDRDAAELDSADIQLVELPQLKLERKDKDFDLSYGDKHAALDSATAGDILENVAGVNISQVLGTANKPEYGLSAPVLKYSLTLKKAGRLDYIFGQLKGSNFYVLRKPGSDFYLKIDSWFVDRIREIKPEALADKAVQLRKLRDSAAKELIEKTKMQKDAVK